MTEEAIRKIARSFLKKNDLYSFPVDLEKALQIIGVHLEFINLNKISGIIMQIENQHYIIGINQRKSYNHQRFTIAHEIGHIILKHLKRTTMLYDFFSIENFSLCHKKYNPIEWEANIFASELLVPTDKLKQLKATGTTSEKLCDFFNVSEQVINYRLKDLNL